MQHVGPKCDINKTKYKYKVLNWTNMGINAVGHEFRLPVRRNEGDCSVTLKT